VRCGEEGSGMVNNLEALWDCHDGLEESDIRVLFSRSVLFSLV
jgi:hypothetical protein